MFSRYKLVLFLVVLFSIPSFPAQAEGEDNEMPDVQWVNGPATGKLGAQAEVKVPSGYRFVDGEDSRKLMILYGNQPTDLELGYIEPVKKSTWFVIFEFESSGYVKDDDASLDADAMLDSLKEGTKAGNEWRKENNLPELTLIGWHTKPRYDKNTHNLEWATLSESNGRKVVNHNIRILGRDGVMSATVVAAPEVMDQAVSETRKILTGYDFSEGRKYSQWVEGDKIAEYGLATLVTGGVAVAAAKSGLLAKLWKFLALGAVAVAAFFKKIWSRITGSGQGERSVISRASAPPGQDQE